MVRVEYEEGNDSQDATLSEKEHEGCSKEGEIVMGEMGYSGRFHASAKKVQGWRYVVLKTT